MVHIDCFAYRSVTKLTKDGKEKEVEFCDALNKLYCKKENCKFYKQGDVVTVADIDNLDDIDLSSVLLQ